MNDNVNKNTHHFEYSKTAKMNQKEHAVPHFDVTLSTSSLSRQVFKPNVQYNSVPLLRIMILFCLLLSLLTVVKADAISNATLEISSAQQYRRSLTYVANQAFNYAASGQPFTFLIPYGVTSIYVEEIGAASGTGDGGTQGLGAKVTSTLSVMPGTTLYIYIGGKGTNRASGFAVAGGFNGGGNGYYGAGGGGAIDIRNGTGTINDSCWWWCSPSNGGNGGSPNGAAGSSPCSDSIVGGGGTQSTGGYCGTVCSGTLGQGGNTYANSGGTGGSGGGGGYYGGGGSYRAGGGGGSSYSIGSSTAYPGATNTGNGSLTIFYDPQPTPSPTFVPTYLPSMPTSQPSHQPSIQPPAKPSSQPTSQPTCQPSSQPSKQPSQHLTSQPSATPSRQPTAMPSTQPSDQPSVSPTCQPTCHPSSQQSSQPSCQPSCQPSNSPSHLPTSQPSSIPSVQPSQQPSRQPSLCPSYQPFGCPSCQPTGYPSQNPSSQPLILPSIQPSDQPTTQPSQHPLAQPTSQPSRQPSQHPLAQPTSPTFQPSTQSSNQPTGLPTSQPNITPSRQPIATPSTQPSDQPSGHPSQPPASQPSNQPTTQTSQKPFVQPTCQPSTAPSRRPSTEPSTQPSGQPTCPPSIIPTSQPSGKPSIQSSSHPSHQPVSHPSLRPPLQPSMTPSSHPSQSSLNQHFFDKSLSLHVKVWSSDFKIVLPFLFVNPVNGDGFNDVSIYNENSERVSNVVALGGQSELKIFETHALVFRDYSSRSVSIAGDLNGDGIDDIIIGVPYASRCYVLYGTKLGFINMTEGFTVYGADPSDLTGWSVSGAGDINNDTYADLIIGAPSAVNSDDILSGVVYILYGGKGLDDIYLNQLNETRGFKLHSSSSQDAFGLSVSGAGDFNGDGFDDVIIGALRMTDYFSGAAYIIYGGQLSENQTINVDTISENNGVVLYGSYHSWFAYSVSGAGDVNGDGFDDVIIGSTPRRATTGIQKRYLIYGTNKSRVVDISSLAPTYGVIIEGGGVIVSGIGDINNDGFDDVKIDSNIDLSLGSGVSITQPMIETPSVSPSNAPSTMPSVRPTRRPTVCTTCKPSVLPTVIQSTVPTVVSSARPSQPTRLPTALPSNPSSRPSSRPSQPTVLPSLEPSVDVTLEPTTEPSETLTQEEGVEIPSDTPTFCPSMLPTQHSSSQLPIIFTPTHGLSMSITLFPTRYSVVRPTISPTEVGNVTYLDRKVFSRMTISRYRAVFVNYIVNTTEDVRFTHSGLVEMFTIVPNKDSRVKIDEFNVSCDIINLEYFDSIHSLLALNMNVVYIDGVLFGKRHLRVQNASNVSLVIELGNNQAIVLVNISQSMLSETNFIFSTPFELFELHIVSSSNNTQEKLIFRVVSCVVIGLIGMYLLIIACVQWQAVRRERLLVPSKFDWEEIKANNVTYLSFTSFLSDDDVNNDIINSSNSDDSGESKIDYESGSHLGNIEHIFQPAIHGSLSLSDSSYDSSNVASVSVSHCSTHENEDSSSSNSISSSNSSSGDDTSSGLGLLYSHWCQDDLTSMSQE